MRRSQDSRRQSRVYLPDCSGCGALVQKGLSVRWHSCPECGTSLHRDHNAAKNIERLGQTLRGAVALAAAENRESVRL